VLPLKEIFVNAVVNVKTSFADVKEEKLCVLKLTGECFNQRIGPVNIIGCHAYNINNTHNNAMVIDITLTVFEQVTQ
jgi:hypothetical protein